MTPNIRTILAVITMVIGFVLMVGGIITGKHGATVVGLCVAAVATQQLIASRKQSHNGDEFFRRY